MARKQKQIGLMSLLRDWVVADSIGKTKNGTVKFRMGFFYTHGRTSENYKMQIMRELNDLCRNAGAKLFTIVDCGMQWCEFNGAGSIANSSHYWVEVRFNEKFIVVANECLAEAMAEHN
jgi:hypothetical protein